MKDLASGDRPREKLLRHGVSVLGDRMVAVALAFAVLSVGGTASEVGLVLACRTLPMVICLLAGGVVADRASRRAVMVTADVVRIGTQGASGGPSPPRWSSRPAGGTRS